MPKNSVPTDSAARKAAVPPADPAGPTRVGRIPVLDPSPVQPGELWPAKAYVGEVVPFAATAFREGHDLIGVELLLQRPGGAESRHSMREVSPGTDRWQVELVLDAPGAWNYAVRAYADDYATWRHNAAVKIAAGVDEELMLAAGAALLERAAAEPGRAASDLELLQSAAADLLDTGVNVDVRLERGASGPVAALLTAQPPAGLESRTEPRTVRVERERAGVGSWYEFFPRSEGALRRPDGSWQSGTFRTAALRLDAVAAMGFDVLYLPPIHPIGESFRKGPNNTLQAGPHDPGSPWAIGSAAGGHDAVHPDLGTLEDFRAFTARAGELGIEVALDLALQASPDHPWVAEHPEWFTTLPDGSIAFAENPPKKYQDIYPINFDNDPGGIRAEVLRIVRHWIAQGIRIFRVDNPHTKPLALWEWLLGVVNTEHPDVIFLAEAFTRPAPLKALARVGFQQSYTYFAWRNTKSELEEFLGGLATDTADYLRPNLWVNTPDILTEYLQFGGPAAFAIRASIAATAAPSWGVYSGFELFESVARPGAEEAIDNEKYEYKPRDFAGAAAADRSLALYLGILNRVRAEHPALRQLRNIRFHSSEDDAVLVYSKHLAAAHSPDGREDAVIVVANLDPHSVRETTVHLDPELFGLSAGAAFQVENLVTGELWNWGEHNYVRLDAFTEPVHILAVRELQAPADAAAPAPKARRAPRRPSQNGS
ncbi:alpha-1,4-glucan--maltose-1-phosphate maltosyltransferase [Microterricola pindariensis]|uniref:Alpha-1,4-glucan:maltose-1-phosphate maltosyltransferase n=1 Tax=Microterricola pindariensis TaxID=478010 RepID=A0ABX5AUK0_9MICO|nr:alpha-1,4-glucan--maltose-1-phosphate maltosyltransferase [Microterricola pindariensis]